MQFQTIISDMKEQWIHTQDGLYSYLVDDRYRMVKPDRFYEFDCKGLLRRDLNWIKDTKFVEEADGGFFCEWLSDWASDYLDNEYINDDTYKIFSDMEDNAWIGNKLGMGDKTGEADQDDTDTETNDDEIVLTVDEKKEMLSSFVQWFYSEERHSKLAAWNDLTGASSPLIGYWQGEHIGMAVINYTDIKYGGLYFYILNTLEDGRMGYTKIYEGNAEKIRLNNHMDLKLEDDTHITLSYKLRNGDWNEAVEYSESLTKGEVSQTILDEYAGKWIDVFGEKGCIDISFDAEHGDININGEKTNDSPEKAENTYLYSSDGVLVCLASDVTQAYDSEYGSFPQYATTTLTLNDSELSYEVEGYYDDRTDNTVRIDENGYGYERVPEGEEPWETAYRNYMEYIEDSKCALFYLNDDDIPEIYFYDTGHVGTYEDGSVHIYENVNGYGDKSVCRIQPNTLVYAPRSNKFVTTNSHDLEEFELNGENLKVYNGYNLGEGEDPNDYQHGISFLAEDNLTGEKVIFYDTVEAAKKALMGN